MIILRFILVIAFICHVTMGSTIQGCKPDNARCDPSRKECCGECVSEATGNRCAGGGGHGIQDPTVNQYDLSLKDLRALCQVVDPSGDFSNKRGCVYMKWVFCQNGNQNDQKPCGWYEQTPCEEQRREKREIEHELLDTEAISQKKSLAQHILLGFPDT